MTALQPWTNLPVDRAPYLFPGDEALLGDVAVSRCTLTSFEAYSESPELSPDAHATLHLGLLPMPYVGDLRQARIFFLMLNPGFGADDYYGEYGVPAYREALLACLRQERRPKPFPFLDPRFSWHGGYCYWERKLRPHIRYLAARHHLSYQDASLRLGSLICGLELLPYHSRGFAVPGRLLKRLPSVDAMSTFVHEELVPRARAGEIHLVALRKAAMWKLPAHRNIVSYRGNAALSASLSEQSAGGKLLRRVLETLNPRAA